jgi:hypothetical protein
MSGPRPAWDRRLAVTLWLALVCAYSGRCGAQASFVANDPTAARPADIVLAGDAARGTGFEWAKVSRLPPYAATQQALARDAARYLQAGLEKMTGRAPAVRSSADLKSGIVLLLLADASPELQSDPAVAAALAVDDSDRYSHREAFFLRSEGTRQLVLAHTADGLVAGAASLLEHVGYEVLGMGPNWVHVPDYRERPLVFDIAHTARPSFYLRSLWATSGQHYGVGTCYTDVTLDDPADEQVHVSYLRWLVGTRTRGRSMPPFPGHALQAYHKQVLDHMRAEKTSSGFLASVSLGPAADRPPPDEAVKDVFWLNTDAKGSGAYEQVDHCDGTSWRTLNPRYLPANLDLSVPFVRAVILASLKQRSAAYFASGAEAPFIFGTDPEDGGGYAVLGQRLHNPQWYPEYCAAAGIPLGEPYVLHGFLGLDQPRETWDPAAASDTVFGFNNWLLREYDSWLDSLPADQQLTAAGQSKQELVRCSLYSYNYHDVPPNFNLDPRIRVMIASYPKHRGIGKWRRFASQTALARAYQVMLPREPSGDYRIISLAYYHDASASGIPPNWSAAPAALVANMHSTHAAGIRAISCETDFNFGKFGLAYYLYAKLLWDATLTVEQLAAIRERWLQRAYGSAWREMKAYYDFMLPENYPVNGPNTWARAIRLIAAADAVLKASAEPAAKRRLDDLKQFWYYYYLDESGKATKADPAMVRFVWKGQMSYMTALHAILRRTFGANHLRQALSAELRKEPAHYSAAETQQWWDDVLAFWPLTPVRDFKDARLVDGQAAAAVDLNDLVRVREFGDQPGSGLFLYNSGYQKTADFVTHAVRQGEPIGFTLIWPVGEGRYYRPREFAYGVQRWHAADGAWQEVVDKTTTGQASIEVGPLWNRWQKANAVRVSLPAPHPGTYRFSLSRGGNYAYLADTGFDWETGTSTGAAPLTYYKTSDGLTQPPVYFYIPKGTASLDLEVWDTYNSKSVTLYKGLPPNAAAVSRKVDISARSTHTIALRPGESGTVAKIEANGFSFPYLYSVPSYWAKQPSALLVPRAIAAADGLTIIE